MMRRNRNGAGGNVSAGNSFTMDQLNTNYNQQPFYQSDFSSDYSNSYDDGTQQYRKPYGKRRQTDNDWQHNSHPKRFAGQGQHGSSYVGDWNERSYGQSGSQKQRRPDAVGEVETRGREALRLQPDKEPSKKMTGRLELALGTILREFREKFKKSNYEILHANALARIMKYGVRERIRIAMLGKVVGTTQEIVKEYRVMFPRDTDAELVNLALEAGVIRPKSLRKPIVNLEMEKPEEYYKTNMILLLERHLNEMCDKVDQIYNPPAASENKGETVQEVDGGEKLNNENEPKRQQSKDSPETAETEAVKEGNATVTNTEGEVYDLADGKDDKLSDIEDLLEHANEYKRTLPQTLKKNIPDILKLLLLKNTYRRGVDEIVATTKVRLVEYNRAIDAAGLGRSPSASTPKKLPASFCVLPYYVKIMGKPQLPKRNLMTKFLEEFNPKSIRKHRSIHNLLFIGFTEKSDFDAIVKANGTVIGRNTLSVRICEYNKGNPDADGDSSTMTDQNNGHDDSTLDDVLKNDTSVTLQEDSYDNTEDTQEEDQLDEEMGEGGDKNILSVDCDEVLEKIDELVNDVE